MVSGGYLIWGVQALPDCPATALRIGFLMMAVGQTAGAPVFGLLIAILAGVFRAKRVIGTVPA